MKNGKGQKAKEEAKEIGFLKLDTSASNRPAERPPIARFLGSENGQFNWAKRVMSQIFRERGIASLRLPFFISRLIRPINLA